MKQTKLMKTLLMVLTISLALFGAGCSKGGGAEDLAKAFVANIESGKAYALVHKYVQTNEILEVSKDTDGNAKTVLTYEDGSVEEIYLLDGAYTLYIDGELVTEYEEADLKEYVDSYLEEASFYANDMLPVFDLDIASDILDLADENMFVAVGQYEDDSAYKYSFDKDGKFIECYDAFDDIKITLDDSVAIQLP